MHTPTIVKKFWPFQIHRKKLALFTSGLVLILLVSSYGLLKRYYRNAAAGRLQNHTVPVDNHLVGFIANVIVDKRFMENICDELDIESCAPR